VGLVVTELEKALSFYQEGLGFRVVVDQIESGPFLERLLGIEGAKARTVKMTLGDITLLELILFNAPKPTPDAKSLARIGFSHIALTVESADQTYAHLRNKGARPISEPIASSDGKVKVFFCRDPEGNFLEIVEELGKGNNK